MTSGKRAVLLKKIDAIRNEIIDLTKELIRFPTINPPGENYPDCVKFIRDMGSADFWNTCR